MQYSFVRTKGDFMKLFAAIFATLFSMTVFANSSELAECLEQNDSTVGREECQQDEYLRLKLDLRSEYIKLRQTRVKDAEQVINSNLSWALKSDSACTAEVADREGGTSQGYAKLECLTRRTQLRIDYVKALLSAE